MSSRLLEVERYLGRPVTFSVITTEGPVPTRSNSFAVCTVFDPADESKPIRRYKGPDSYRQFAAWKNALKGFPLLIQSFFCGTVVAARRVTADGVCHVC